MAPVDHGLIARGRENSKLELGSACFMAGWGWVAGELTGGAIDG